MLYCAKGPCKPLCSSVHKVIIIKYVMQTCSETTTLIPLHLFFVREWLKSKSISSSTGWVSCLITQWVLKKTEYWNYTVCYFSTVAPSKYVPYMLGLSAVKLDQQLLTRGVTTGTGALLCTDSLLRTETFFVSSTSRVQPVRRGWLSPPTTCCLHELTWRLPPTDDVEEAAWLEGSQKLKKDSRKKGETVRDRRSRQGIHSAASAPSLWPATGQIRWAGKKTSLCFIVY